MLCNYVINNSCVFRYGSFHGQDENLLLRRFNMCKRTPSYSKLLPSHSYEVDMPPKEGITVSVVVCDILCL